MKQRLDLILVNRGLVPTRSQAESYVRLGAVMVNGRPAAKAGQAVTDTDIIELKSDGQYVSRAGLKLASVAQALHIDFAGKTVLDVGSSTGGFTDYALQHGARKVIAVDVGTDQMHPLLRQDARIELHERTDIRSFLTDQPVDVIVADVSFISLREILPSVVKLCQPSTDIIAMVKPQFEAGTGAESGRSAGKYKHHGVIKNDRMRRDILKDFEQWSGRLFRIVDKADSAVAGSKGNVERFYKLRVLK